MPKDPYTLFEYQMNGNLVVSAIHALDIRKFLSEHPEAKVKVTKWKLFVFSVCKFGVQKQCTALLATNTKA